MKLKRSKFNEYNGVSVVMLENHGKTYTGEAILHPDDWEHMSKYAGCRIAEKRAYIKYWQEKRHEARLKRDALISFYKDLSNVAVTNNHTISNFVIKRICVHINYWNEAYKDAKYKVDYLKTSIESEIKTREKLINRTKESN